ncbi:hypothetical protein BGZ82_004201 [Podila clonocystis]|nr:hypothetical protein BGZ82_004201 [Podila clonocystis]
MASTSRHVISRGASLAKHAQPLDKCTRTMAVRYRHTSASSAQDDAHSRNRQAHGTTGFQHSAFPLLTSPTHYTHLVRNNLTSLIFHRSVVTNHNFNTNKVVTKLEKNGFQRGQAEGVMRAIKALLGQHTTKIRKNMLTGADLGNESYLFKAALTELRTELQILRKNDAAALAIKSEIISREIDSLNQKLREDIANVKNDIAIDMNSRKSDVREEQKALEIRIQSMSNHYMAQLGDMRTKMEAAKWEATRKGMVTIFISAAFVLLTSRILIATKDDKMPEDYIDPYINHSNAQHDKDGMVPDSFVVSHRT